MGKNISSSLLYVGYDKLSSSVFGVTNLRLLQKKTGIKTWKLSRLFKQEEREYYEDENCIIIVLETGSIETGMQKIPEEYLSR